MYGILLTIVPRGPAGWLCAIWYTALVVAIVLLCVEQPADFNYVNR